MVEFGCQVAGVTLSLPNLYVWFSTIASANLAAGKQTYLCREKSQSRADTVLQHPERLSTGTATQPKHVQYSYWLKEFVKTFYSRPLKERVGCPERANRSTMKVVESRTESIGAL